MTTDPMIREASDKLRDTKDAARAAAVAAADLALTRLRTELGGEIRLLGLPNLATSSAPYRALPVRRTSEIRFSLRSGQRMLALTEKGELVYAEMTGSGVTETMVPTEELLAQDLELLIETIGYAARLHLQRVEKKSLEYQRISRFAAAVEKALS